MCIHMQIEQKTNIRQESRKRQDFPSYTQGFNKSIKKNEQPIEKLANTINKQFTENDIQIANKYMKRTLMSHIVKYMQIKNKGTLIFQIQN